MLNIWMRQINYAADTAWNWKGNTPSPETGGLVDAILLPSKANKFKQLLWEKKDLWIGENDVTIEGRKVTIRISDDRVLVFNPSEYRLVSPWEDITRTAVNSSQDYEMLLRKLWAHSFYYGCRSCDPSVLSFFKDILELKEWFWYITNTLWEPPEWPWTEEFRKSRYAYALIIKESSVYLGIIKLSENNFPPAWEVGMRV